ncbi:MAG: hypothetical protein ACRBB6_12750 [Neptuniibacter sp.]
MKIQTVSLTEHEVNIDLALNIDLSGLAGELITQMNRRFEWQECGKRIYTRNSSVQADGRGNLLVATTGTFQQWTCIKPIGFKTKLLSQSARMNAVATPVLGADGKTVSVHVKATKVKPDGLLGVFTNLFGLNGTLKAKLQEIISRKLNGKTIKMPAELAAYDVTIKKLAFIVVPETGGLGLQVHATAAVTQAQLDDLMKKQAA